jgi:hypothetical protein
MIALVSVETVLLVLLLILVAGLLRSHAEILRRIGPQGGVPAPGSASALPQPAAAAARAHPGEQLHAPPLSGMTPSGDAVRIAFDGAGAHPTLLAFLTSGCSSCAGFWGTLAAGRLPDGIEPVIVARGSDRERPAKLRSLAPAEIPVIMSSQAWEDYRVPGAPYFVFVDGTIRGEGAATGWEALASLIGDALEDQREARSSPRGPRRAARIDATLQAAGIERGHPSLYPAGREERP